MTEWISSYTPPDDSRLVLCYDEFNTFISLGRYIEEEDCFELMSVMEIEPDTEVTHWMQIVLPPKEEE